jgi:archaellum component FlaC
MEVSLVFSLIALLLSLVGGAVIKVAFSRMFKGVDDAIESINEKLECLDSKFRDLEVATAKIQTSLTYIENNNPDMSAVLNQLNSVLKILGAMENRVNKNLRDFKEILEEN